MLKVGGENVAASEIEQVISVVPGVREAAVVAKKYPMLDEVPVVFIIPAAGVEGAPEDLHDTVMAACRGALADFKVPREIRFVDEMPRSTLEKVGEGGAAEAAGVAVGSHRLSSPGLTGRSRTDSTGVATLRVWLNRRNSSRVSAGVFQPRVFRGLVFSTRATASRSSTL